MDFPDGEMESSFDSKPQIEHEISIFLIHKFKV